MAGTTVGKLNVLLTADTAGLFQEFGKAEGAAARYGTSIEKLNAQAAEGLINQDQYTQRLNAATAAFQKSSGAASIIAATRTPLETYNQQLARLSNLLKLGAIDQATHSRAVQQASATYKSATTSVSTLGASFSTLQSVMAFAGVAVGAAAVSYALKRVVTSSMESIEAVKDLSVQLGVGTEELTRLQYAARITGMSTDSFNKSFSKFVKNVGSASLKMGPVIETSDGMAVSFGKTTEATNPISQALKKLGLNADELAAKSPAEAFKDTAQALSEWKNISERNALAFTIFGKQYGGMLEIIEGGRAGIERAGQDADKLGLTFSKFDAELVEQANESIRKLKESAGGLGNTLTILLAPGISSLATGFNLLLNRDIPGLFDAITGSMNRGLHGWSRLGEFLSGKVSFKEIIRDLEGHTEATNSDTQAQKDLADAFVAVGENGQKAIDGLQKQIDEFGKSKLQLDIADLEKAKAAFGGQGMETGAIDEQITKLKDFAYMIAQLFRGT